MIRVSEREFIRDVARYKDLAQAEPIIVTHDGLDRTVMISVEEYRRLQHRDRQVYAAGELPEEWLDAVERAEMDPRHNHLDELLETQDK
jgi:hypothetical protein